MSEFSDSYHIKADNIQVGRDLLKRANLRGFIFPSVAGWVTIAPQGDMFDPNQRLLEISRGLLVHFTNAEDFGWGFTLYQNGIRQTSYFCDWTEDITITERPDIALAEKLLNVSFSSLEDEKTRQIFFPESFEEVFQTQPATQFAELIGLVNYSWISYEHLLEHSEDFPSAEHFKP